jgi:DNA-directed RNA polymerase specialized sigma24 family protein
MNLRPIASLDLSADLALTTPPSTSTAANDNPLAPVASFPSQPRRAREDLVTRAYRVLAPNLRAACKRFVPRQDVDDLVQDVFVVASRSPAKLAQTDRATLNWLIGIARRTAAPHVRAARMLPIEALLEREAGDDREGEAPFAPMPW